MRLIGFLLLLTGWLLVIAAIVLFPVPVSRVGFVICGLAVEALGFVLVFRSHLIPKEDKR